MRTATFVLLILLVTPGFGAQRAGPYSFTLIGKAFDERCVRLEREASLASRVR